MESEGNNINPEADHAHSDSEDKKDNPPTSDVSDALKFPQLDPPDSPSAQNSSSTSDSISNSHMDSEMEVEPKSPHQNDDGSEDTSTQPQESHPTIETLSLDIDKFLSSLPQGMIVSSLKPLSIEEKKQEDQEVHEGDGDNKHVDPIPEEGEKAISNVIIKDEEHKTEDEVSKVDKDEKEVNKNQGDNISSIEMPNFIEKFVDLVDAKITDRADSQDQDGKRGKWGRSSEDDSLFLEMVNRLTRLTTFLNDFRSDLIHAPLVNRIGSIHHKAMAYLDDEFRYILEEHTKSIEPDSTGKVGKSEEGSGEGDDHSPLPELESKSQDEHESPYPGYSEEVVSNMRNIGKEMITAGYESECYQVYMIVRRHAIDECLIQSGFEKISIDEVHKMAWENLEREIPIMTAIMKDCTTFYFPKEHKLVHSVFPHHDSLSSTLFSNLARGVVIQFLNFAEGVAMSKRSTEKLFKFLDIYETLRDGFAAIEGLFPEETDNELKSEVTTAKGRIGEAAINIFSDLENSIKNDHGKTPVPGGAVHPLTRYTMNYLKYAFEYKTTLENVFRDHSKIERADSTSRPRFEGDSTHNYHRDGKEDSQSPFANQLARIMDFLDTNLEEKSHLYKDVSLCCIFMMNNGRYILQKIKSSPEIHSVMGDAWSRRKSSDLRNFHKGYQRETWSKVLGCLAHEGIQVHGKVVKPVLKERFKNFNLMFDEIHKTQSAWVVSDEQLQSELRISISAVVIPAYRGFMGRFSQYFTPGRQYEKYIKFQPEDIENYIEELFDGNAGSMSRKRP